MSGDSSDPTAPGAAAVSPEPRPAGHRRDRPVVVSSAALPFDITPILGDVHYIAPAPGPDPDEVDGDGSVDGGGRPGEFAPDPLRAALADARALISLLSLRVDDDLLAAAPALRIVANFAVGFDNIDLAAATRRGVLVTNTPDVLTEATADFTFALLLSAARRVLEGDRLVRSGTWTGWAPGQHLGADVAGATLGIIGMGRIGQAVARRARGFAMTILYTSRGRHRDCARLQAELGAVQVDLAELLERADFVTVHCPATPSTSDLIDAAALETMKNTAILINTSRGSCVDEPALARALHRGAIAGAALDVFAREPAVHPELLSCDRVVLAPHAGSATTTARRRMAEICANAVRAALDGRKPRTLVNPEAWQAPEVRS